MGGVKRPTVVITSANRWSYYQWFLLGFHELRREGKINLKVRVSLSDWWFSNLYRDKLGRILHLKRDKFNLNGYVRYPDNTKKYFCIDSQDSPFLIHSEDLQQVDCYFKMQCPTDLEKDYFPLTPHIHIPWMDHAHKDDSIKGYEPRGERKLCAGFSQNRKKIRPLMVGPRHLCAGISYFDLKRGYKHYIRGRKIQKTKKLMCYFGNAKGPKPEANVTTPDYNWEPDIMGYYGDLISHPNEKRARAATIIKTMGRDYDARIITDVDSNGNVKQNKGYVVPLKDFCEYVADFQYNLNVSGYRLSIPNRFIESFMVGTAIVTDKLAVRWYLPFDKDEVIETVEMGYKKNEDVDWATCEDDLKNLPDSNPEKIIECFEKKWAPKKVAEYILNEINNS